MAFLVIPAFYFHKKTRKSIAQEIWFKVAPLIN